MEGWFAADAETISAKCWDQVSYILSLVVKSFFCIDCFLNFWFNTPRNVQEELLPGGHGLMVRGYRPVINTLAKGLDIRVGHR